MKEFKFRISADVSDLEAQFKSGANQLTKFVKGIGDAENKLEKLQETGAYLSQMDAALASIANKYPDVFKKIFGNIDADVKSALAPILETPALIGEAVNQIGSKLQGILGGKGGSVQDFKEISDAMNALTKGLGGKNIDFSFLDGASSSIDKANQLLDVLQGIIQTSAQFKTGTSGSINSVINNIGQAAEGAAKNIDELKSKIDNLAKITEKNKNLELYSKEGLKEEMGDAPGQYLMDKIKEYKAIKNEAQGAFQKLTSGELLSENDYQILIKYIEAFSRLKTIEQNFKVGPKFGLSELIDNGGIGEVKQTAGMIKLLQDTMNQKKGASSGSANAKQETQAYAELIKQLKEYIKLRNDATKLPSDSPDRINKEKSMKDILSNISGKYGASIAELESKLGAGVGEKTGLKNLKTILGDKFPAQYAEDAKKTAEALEDVADASRKIDETAPGQPSPDKPKQLTEAYKELNQQMERYLQLLKESSSLDEYSSEYDSVTAEMEQILGDISKKYKVSEDDLGDALAGEGIDNINKAMGVLQNTLGNKFPPQFEEGAKSAATAIDQAAAAAENLNAQMGEVKDQVSRINENDSAKNVGLENEIKSYQQLIDLLTEYQNLEKQKKKVDQAPYDFYIDTQFVKDRYGEGGKDAVMKDFQDIWGKKNALNQKRIKSPEYLDLNMYEAAGQEIAQYEEELKRLAAAYIDLGGSVDDFKSKEKRAFAQNNVDLFNSQKEQYEAAVEEADKYNKQFEKRQYQISKMLKADGTDIGNTAELIQNVENFGNVEESAKKMTQALGIEIPQAANNAGVAVEDLKAKTEASKQSLEQFYAMTEEIRHAGIRGDQLTDIDIGKNMEGLENAKKQLQELANQGLITAEEMQKVESAYVEANKQLQDSAKQNEYNRSDLVERPIHGDDDYNLLEHENDSLLDQVNDLEQDKDILQDQVTNLEEQLRKAQEVSTTSGDTSSEATIYESLQQKITAVTAAINEKTAAFTNEGNVVDSVVAQEITALEKLQERLTEIANTVGNIGKIDLGSSLSEIDKILAKLADPSTNIEYLGMFNSKTGKVSDQLFGGDNGRSEGTFKNKSDYDTMFHNHPGVSTAAPSATDWGTFAKEFDNFKRQIIVTKDEIATFDLSGLTKKEMNEVAEEIQTALRTTTKNKSFVKNVEAYGLEEAEQMWQRDLAAPILAKYSGVKMSVESTDRLFPKGPDQQTKDVRIEGAEKLEASISSLQKAIETAIATLKKPDKDSSKKKDETQKESKQKKATDTFETDKNKIQESFNSYSNSLNRDFVPQESLDKLSEMEARLKNITNGDELKEWKQDWNEVTKSISQATKESEGIALAKQKLQLNGLKNSVKDNYKSAKINPDNMTAEQEALSQSYDDLIAKLETYAKQRRILSQEEMADLKKTATAIKAQANVYAQAAKAQAQSAKAYKVIDEKTEEDKMIKLFGAVKNSGLDKSSTVIDRMRSVENAYDSLVSKQKEFAASGTEPTREQKIEMQSLADAYKTATTELEALVRQSKNLDKNAIWQQPVESDVSTEANRKAVLESTVRQQYGNSKIKLGDFAKDAKELSYSVKNADGTWSHFTATLNNAGTAVTGVSSKLKDTDGIIKRLVSGSWRKIQDAFTRFTGFDMFYRGIAQIRQGIQYITEIDTALTELKKVTNKTDEVYAQFLQTASKTGAEIGSTVADFTNATADFARLGYSISEASKLAEAASIYKNVGD